MKCNRKDGFRRCDGRFEDHLFCFIIDFLINLVFYGPAVLIRSSKISAFAIVENHNISLGHFLHGVMKIITWHSPRPSNGTKQIHLINVACIYISKITNQCHARGHFITYSINPDFRKIAYQAAKSVLVHALGYKIVGYVVELKLNCIGMICVEAVDRYTVILGKGVKFFDNIGDPSPFFPSTRIPTPASVVNRNSNMAESGANPDGFIFKA